MISPPRNLFLSLLALHFIIHVELILFISSAINLHNSRLWTRIDFLADLPSATYDL